MNKKRAALIAVTVAMLAIALSGMAASVASAEKPLCPNGDSDVTLSASVTASAVYTKTITWGIDKTVTPATWNLFKGDSGTSQYTITVTKDVNVEAYVEGQVTVTNGNYEKLKDSTQNLAITVTMIQTSAPGPDKPVIASQTLDLSEHPILSPGQTWTYSYKLPLDLNNLPDSTGTYKVTADVTCTNHAGHYGIPPDCLVTPWGPHPSTPEPGFSWPASPTVIGYDQIHVVDGANTWTFSDSGSQTYIRTFTKDDVPPNENTATITNTAKITETGLTAEAPVTVNIYKLDVSKTADTTFTRTYAWTLAKSASQPDQSTLTLSTGQVWPVTYTITPSAKSTDSNWQVTGTITVKNPAPIAATINSASDVVSPDIAATVTWNGWDGQSAYTLPAGQTLTGTYTANLPDATSRTNTATVTIQNYAYASDGSKTELGTNDFSGTAAVDFANAKITEIDKCIDVTDILGGSLGTVCYGDLPKTLTYTYNIKYDTCGQYKVENKATFTTKDTQTTGDSNTWTINVNVPCAGGCTLTPGYWMTHSILRNAPYDTTWSTLETTQFYHSGNTYVQEIQYPGGSAYYQLSFQYIAAKLNILGGASVPDNVKTAMAHADSLFSAVRPDGTYYKPTDNVFNPSVTKDAASKALRQDYIDTATILANYNLGVTGPGHCSE